MTSEPTAGPEVRASPRSPTRRSAFIWRALLIGAAFGVLADWLTSRGHGLTALPGYAFNDPALWGVLAFGVGLGCRAWWQGAVGGVLAEFAALVAYYASGTVFSTDNGVGSLSEFLSTTGVFAETAILAGVIFGVTGALAARPGRARYLWWLAVPAPYLLEPVAAGGIGFWNSPAFAAAEMILAAIMAVGLLVALITAGAGTHRAVAQPRYSADSSHQ